MFQLPRPGQKSHRNQGVSIVTANRRAHSSDPLAGDLVARAARRIKSNVLKEIVTAEQASRRPLSRWATLCGGDRFVHQVVAKYGWTRRTLFGDRLPELFLR